MMGYIISLSIITSDLYYSIWKIQNSNCAITKSCKSISIMSYQTIQRYDL